MPVPSTIADLSATASSNYPQGSESPSTLDDYIRAQGSIIRQVSDAKADTSSLSASSGASMVGYQPSGTGAVSTNVQSKLREIPSVLDFSADASGVIDSTNAFSLAAKSSPATIILQFENVSLSTPMSPVVLVRVPAGSYKITSQVDTGGREVVWIFETGAVIANYNDNYLGGRVVRDGQRVVSLQHYGTRDYACGYSVIANNNLNASAGVLGFDAPSGMSVYSDRDSVGFYAENHSPALVATLVSPTYTATTVTCPTPVDVKKLRVGMIIDTAHATKYSGMITGWAADGSSITVSAWYIVDGTRNTGTPANGTNAYVNAVTKAWGQNTNIYLDSGCFASQATGFELGCFNNKAAPASEGANPKVWGYDSVNLGTYKCESAFIARAGSANFYNGFESQNCDTGFYQTGDGIAFKTKGGGQIFQALNNVNAGVFTISSSGSMELGATNVVGDVYMDFHTSGNNIDYDARIIATGGTASAGNGLILVHAAELVPKQLRPVVDGIHALGTGTFRWSTVYAATGTINTSDERYKRNIKTLDDQMALSLLQAVDAKTFQWVDDDIPAQSVKKTVSRQKTVKVIHPYEEEELEVIDGKAVLRKVIKEREVEELVYDEYPVIDENGKPVMEVIGKGISRPRMHKVPVMEEVEEETHLSDAFQKTNTRTHFGFIAQDFEKALQAAGLTSQDFAGLVIDKESGKYGLRYEQVLTILWPIVKGLVAKVEAIENK